MKRGANDRITVNIEGRDVTEEDALAVLAASFTAKRLIRYARELLPGVEREPAPAREESTEHVIESLPQLPAPTVAKKFPPLSALQKKALALHEKGKTVPEISKLMGKSQPAVHSYRHALKARGLWTDPPGYGRAPTNAPAGYGRVTSAPPPELGKPASALEAIALEGLIAGTSIADIAAEMKKTPQQVQNYRYGLKRKGLWPVKR